MKRLRTVAIGALLAAAFAAPGSAHDFKAGSIAIDHPWSRATPAGAKVAAGYLTIQNPGDTPDRLVSASAEIAGRTEIHEMAVANGVMTMRQIDQGVAVPAKGEARLAPAGIHIMFMDLKRQLKQGESFAGVLTFEKAGEVKVEFAVQSIGATQADHGASGGGHGHDHATEKAK